jgi:hypothetical protein
MSGPSLLFMARGTAVHDPEWWRGKASSRTVPAVSRGTGNRSPRTRVMEVKGILQDRIDGTVLWQDLVRAPGTVVHKPGKLRG